jgi:threonine dehydrogenase-like Zn-dependent dehydrogenase
MMELTNGVGADAVCEAVGTAESMLQAVRTVRPGGMVGCVGVPHGVELRSSRAAPQVRCTGGRAPGRRAIHHRRSSSVLKPIYNGSVQSSCRCQRHHRLTTF